jgi:chorismate synthase
MAGNSFGNIFKLTSFGESHGEAIGGIVDGCPAGLKIDFTFIKSELDRRKPGQSKIVSQRKESDKVEFLSGIYEGTTTGTPIGFIIRNNDSKSKDYDHLKNTFRPSHADFTYEEKYGIRDHRGGGRSSARETAVRVVAGAIAKLILKKHKISIDAFVSSVGDIALEKEYTELNLKKTESNIVRCPDATTAKRMIEKIESVRKKGDTIGGVVSCIIKNSPSGLGEPVFDKMHAELGKAMLSINAVKGFEYGSGFYGTLLQGTQHNDVFIRKGNKIKTVTNHSGGIQGGITNGMDIYFRVAFKPVATIMKLQDSVSSQKKKIKLEGKGRHDPCVVPRAVPVVEAMASLVMVDFLLLNSISKLK